MSVELEAGPELDAAVAKAIGIEGEMYDGEFFVRLPGRMFRSEWRPSTDLNAAFEAAEKAELFGIETHPRDPYKHLSLDFVVGMWRMGYLSANCAQETLAHATTPAVAICRAILKLKGQ